MRIHRTLLAALAAGSIAIACNQIFGIEEGHAPPEASDGSGGDGPGSDAPGGDAGDGGAEAEVDACAVRTCAGSEACAEGLCQPDVVVDDSHGLVTMNKLELSGATLYGTNAGAVGVTGPVWTASVVPKTSFAYLMPPTNTGEVGGLAIDDTTAWYGIVTGAARGVWHVPLDAGADAAPAIVGGGPVTVPVLLAVDRTNPFTYVADGTSPGTLIRDAKTGSSSSTCIDFGTTPLTDLVAHGGNLYWAGSELGRASASQIAQWTGGCIRRSSTTGIAVAALGVDATSLYISRATDNMIQSMPLISCAQVTCGIVVNCGIAADGCGDSLNCGSCTAPNSCGGGGVPSKCGMGTCTPQTTCDAGACGVTTDGCGGILNCGLCAAPSWCGVGGATNNRCDGKLVDVTASVAMPAPGSADSPRHLVSDGIKVYWAGQNGNIWAVAADGSSTKLEQVLDSKAIRVGAIAVDSSFVYFTDNQSHQVFRVSK